MRAAFCACALAALLAAAPPAARAGVETHATRDSSGVAHVSYVSSGVVYIDAGRADGLAEGDRLHLMRGATKIGALEVKNLSSKRASCALVVPPEGATPEPRTGDLVLWSPHAPETQPAVAPAAEPAPEPPRRRSRGWMSDHGLRGRVGLRVLTGYDHARGELGYTQPALDLRLDGKNVGGAGVDLSVDARARRTWTGGGTSGRDATKVYKLALGTRRGPWSFTLGRQVSWQLGAVGTFDGALVERKGEVWTAGVLSGSQPDPSHYGFATEVVEHGLYLQAQRGNPLAGLRASLTTGLVGSYRQGRNDREFATIQLRLDSPRHSAYGGQEVDLNRGWKRDQEGTALTLTSSYFHVRERLTEALSVSAGYDNRRSARLYRESVTPETEFDDRYRQGGSAGVQYEFESGLKASVEGRRSRSTSSDRAESWTGSLSTGRLPILGMTARARSTRFSNQRTGGWLHTGAASLQLRPSLHLELQGGTRRESSKDSAFSGGVHDWLGIDLDATITRHMYMMLSEEREVGEGERTDRVFTSVSYRF